MQTKKLIHLTAICAVFFLVLLLCFINSINGRIDFSKDKVFTLSDYSKNLLSNVSEKVQITYYVSDKLSSLYPEARDVKDFLIEYASKSKLVSVSIQDPQKTGLEQKLLSLGIEAQQIQTSTATETSFVSVYSAIVLEYRGKIEMIPFVVSTAGLEFELTSMLQFLIYNITRKVQILVGNDFTLDNDYMYLVPWLESAGFLCTQVFQTELAKLDYSIPLLVLGSKNLKADDIFEIENFIMQGGNAAFCVSKNNVNIYTDWTAQPDTNTLLTDLLDYWGISIQNQLVLDIINYRIEMQSDKQDSRNEYINYPFWIVTGRHSLNFENILSFGYSGLETYWANPIELFEDSNLNKITPILKTSTKASLMSEPFDTDPFRNKTRIFEDKAQYILAATLQGKVKGYYTTAESPNVKIFVLADQYAPSRMIEYTNSPHNMDFFVSVLLWLSNEDNLLQIKNKGIRSTSLESISNIEGVFSALKMTIFLCFILPLFILIITYCCFVFYRKRIKK